MLRLLVFTLLASGLALGCLAQTPDSKLALPERIRAQRWQKRVVVLCAPTTDAAELQQQKAKMTAVAQSLKERDILVLDAIEANLTSAEKSYVRQTLGVAPGAFAIVLLGKDGGVKLKRAQPIAPATLFGTVDKMPMRRQEMRLGVVEH